VWYIPGIMLKWLAIFGLLVLGVLGCAQKPLPMNGGQQQQQPQPHAETPHPAAPQPCTSEVCKENTGNAERYAYYKAHPKEYLKAAIAPANLSNWILAGLGVIGGIVALGTLLVIKRQTDHMVASERAWLIAKSAMDEYRPYEEDKPVFYWSIINKGKTAARLIETQCVYEILNIEQLDALSPVPVYHLPTQFNRMPLLPEDSIIQSANLIHLPQSSALDRFEDGDLKVVQIGLLFLLAYGYVKYLDAFGNERESRFIEKYIWPSPGVRSHGFKPYLDAPSEYTKCT
jgi:hypothetical protein